MDKICENCTYWFDSGWFFNLCSLHEKETYRDETCDHINLIDATKVKSPDIKKDVS